jgi:hypothetical protein
VRHGIGLDSMGSGACAEDWSVALSSSTENLHMRWPDHGPHQPPTVETLQLHHDWHPLWRVGDPSGLVPGVAMVGCVTSVSDGVGPDRVLFFRSKIHDAKL